MRRVPHVLLAAVGVLVCASSGWTAGPGKAIGTFTYDSTTVKLTNAVETKVENLFDSGKKDTLVVVTDIALGATATPT